MLNLYGATKEGDGWGRKDAQCVYAQPEPSLEMMENAIQYCHQKSEASLDIVAYRFPSMLEEIRKLCTSRGITVRFRQIIDEIEYARQPLSPFGIRDMSRWRVGILRKTKGEKEGFQLILEDFSF